MDEIAQSINFAETSSGHKKAANNLIIEVRQWFNTLKLEVLPHTLYERGFLTHHLMKVEAAIQKQRVGENLLIEDVIIEEAKRLVDEEMETVSSIILTVPPISVIAHNPSQSVQASYNPNTAFILMAMDPSQPELDDVRNTIKEVCGNFGIRALRADDVEHQDKITDLILQYINNSEFLIADLTGERPNVYYEIGYAHATGKRPILYRKQGTTLHFDLSVHNVPEYKNMTELRTLLTKRFEAILGRKAGQS